MGNKLKTFLLVLVAMAFTGLGIHYIVVQRQSLQLKAIEVKSLSSDYQELNLKYDVINQKLNEANKDKANNQAEIKKLEEDKQKADAERKRLEAELQAKLDAKTKLAKASENVVNTATGTQTAYAASAGGTKENWMTAAGIPQSDWQFVNCVIAGCDGVSAEGGWDGVQRWNTAGSGAYGLCQALPGNKMASAGADWETNPVTQLKWCHSYAQKYGGWSQAWQFRKCLGQCWSNSANRYVTKDHTWW